MNRHARISVLLVQQRGRELCALLALKIKCLAAWWQISACFLKELPYGAVCHAVSALERHERLPSFPLGQ